MPLFLEYGMKQMILHEIEEIVFFQLIDDSLSEMTEQFEVELSSPSYGSRLGQVSKATVFIDGPNDGELLH